MDAYFKLQRAKEEIYRLNIEIRRVITYIRDEDIFLRSQEVLVHATDPLLAHQIGLFRRERGRFNGEHVRRFAETAKLHGFTGSLIPGTSISTAAPHDSSSPLQEAPNSHNLTIPPLAKDLQDLDDEEAGDEEEVAVCTDLYNILQLSGD